MPVRLPRLPREGSKSIRSSANFQTSSSIGPGIANPLVPAVCVLATGLDAIDRGFGVMVVEDGLCSSSNQGHDALMMCYRTRFTEQIELLFDAVLEFWREGP